MKPYFTVLLLLALQVAAAPGGSAAAIPALNAPAFQAEFPPENDAVLLDEHQIEKYNRRIVRQSPSVYDLVEYPPAVAAAQLQRWLAASDTLLDDTLYKNGDAIGWQEKQALLGERNAAAAQQPAAAAYGVTVRRANLRALPTAEGLFESPGDRDFDILQETAVDPAEPLVILHASASGAFKFVQTRNYRGWIAAADIAAAPREQWLRYVRPESFLVVTDTGFTLTANGEPVFYQMGAKLTLTRREGDAYVIAAPGRGPDGALVEQPVAVAPSPALHVGFLPYTRNQIVRQSLKFLGAPYGWGGLKNSVDCSSFIAAVYRTVGIELPRNADEQEATAGLYLPLENAKGASRQLLLSGLGAGDALFFDGHTMLYLGEQNGAPYIIHALGSHTRFYADGSREKCRAMQVVVSDLTLRRYSGITFLDALTGAISYH